MKKLFYVFAVIFMFSFVPACNMDNELDELTVDLPESDTTNEGEEEVRRDPSKKN